MRLIHEVCPGTALVMANLAGILYVPTLIPTHVGQERADCMEIIVAAAGITGGATTSILTAQARGYDKSYPAVFSGSPLAPSAATWAAGRVLMGQSFTGLSIVGTADIFSGVTTPSRGETLMRSALGVGAPIDEAVIVGIFLLSGTGYTGGTLTVERIRFFNSQGT